MRYVRTQPQSDIHEAILANDFRGQMSDSIPPWLVEMAAKLRLPTDDLGMLCAEAKRLSMRAKVLSRTVDRLSLTTDTGKVPPAESWPKWLREKLFKLGCLRTDFIETMFACEGLALQPRWKRHGRDTVNPCAPQDFHISGADLVFPKIGRMPLVLHRPLEGRPNTATITRDVDQWFVSISCEVDIADPVQRPGVIGLDRGVVNITADSDGHREPNPKFLKQQEDRIARARRRVAKSVKGSANRKKGVERVARLFRKVRRQRDHVLHAISNRYAKSHGTVVVEKLQIRNMTASARGTVEDPGVNVRQKAGLNRSILDAGWGRLLVQLRYKLAWAGGQLEEVTAAYSSQTCAACGVRDAASRISQSEFVCVACGHRDHADVNAAKVILSRRIGGGAVCGGYPIVGPVKQKLRVVRRGTRHGGQGSKKAPAFRPE